MNSNSKYLQLMAGLDQLSRRRNSVKEKPDQDKEVPQIAQESVKPVDPVVDSQASEPNLANSNSEQGPG